MTTIKGMLDKVKSVDLRSEVPVIVQRTSAYLILLNQEQLFVNGIDANGDPITPEYKSKYYAAKKHAKNPQPGFGRPDLKDTGDFYKDFYVTVDKTAFEVDSKDNKSSSLIEKYGEKIFGLSRENKSKYSLGPLAKGIQRYITLKTGLVFR